MGTAFFMRHADPEPDNFLEEFLDERYGDEWMENRWPNIIIAGVNQGNNSIQ